MSGKRAADEQMDSYNFQNFDDEDDEVPVQSKASAEVLAKRKILKPRSRLAGRNPANIPRPAQTSSFGFNFQPMQKTVETNNSNPFSSFAKPEENKVNPFSAFAPTSLTTTNTSTSATTNTIVSIPSDDASKIKALNDNFYNKITAEKNLNPLADFTPILTKYINYIDEINNNKPIEPKQIENKPEIKALPSSEFNKPSFSFGTDIKPIEPTFSFNKPTASVPVPAPVPASAPIPAKSVSPDVIAVDEDESSDDEIKVEGPTFTLAKPPTTTDSVFKLSDAKPSALSTSTGPSFTFASNGKKFDNPFKLTPATKPEAVKEEPKEEPKEAPKETPKPTFLFGEVQKNEPTKPAFSFNFKPAEPTEKPSFSLPTKPAFGSTEGEKPKIEFNFSKPATSDKPTFSFGSNATPAPSFGGNATPAPSFGGASSFSFNFSKPAAAATTTEETAEDKPDEEEPKVQFKAVAKLQEDKVEEKTGEEDEELLYTKRSKIQKFDKEKNSYESKGLGDLKVLLNKSNKKARILVRADGSNRVILNVPILKEFKYEKISPKGNLIKIPIVEDGKLETYLSQVKTGEDGTNLLEALDKAKQAI